MRPIFKLNNTEFLIKNYLFLFLFIILISCSKTIILFKKYKELSIYFNMKEKTCTLKNFTNCLTEAASTITEYWVDNLSTDLSINEIEVFVNEINSQLVHYDENDFELTKIINITATPLHTCEYDVENELLPEKAYSGLIVIVKDPDSNKTLIIDGNHRFNTFQKLCPHQQVYSYFVYGKLP